MKINDKVYDILKWIAQYLLPGAGTLYFALAQIWGLPYGEEVVGTITAVDTFLGVILGISSSAYKKSDKDGTLMINKEDPEKDIYRISMNVPLEELEKKDIVSLKVDPCAKF